MWARHAAADDECVDGAARAEAAEAGAQHRAAATKVHFTPRDRRSHAQVRPLADASAYTIFPELQEALGLIQKEVTERLLVMMQEAQQPAEQPPPRRR